MPACILVLASIHHLQRWCVSFFVLRLSESDSHFLFVIFHILCGIWLPLSASILSFLCPACAIMAITDQITKSFSLWTIMDVNRRLDDRTVGQPQHLTSFRTYAINTNEKFFWMMWTWLLGDRSLQRGNCHPNPWAPTGLFCLLRGWHSHLLKSERWGMGFLGEDV